MLLEIKNSGLFRQSHGDKRKNAVIFIHGYQGHHEDTWRINSKSEGLIYSLVNDPELKDFDVYSYSYSTSFSFAPYDFKTVSDILYSDIKSDLLGCNIFFVTHSMGGLVAQQYIINRYQNNEVTELKRIKGIAFLGVPFLGSIFGIFALNRQGRCLRIGGKHLQELKSSWEKFVTRGGTRLLSDDLKHEFLRLSVISAKDKVVSTKSSNPFHVDSKEVFTVDETHKSISKGNKNSPTYKHIKNSLLNAIKGDTTSMLLGVNGYDKRIADSVDYIIDWTDYFDITTKPRMLPDPNTWKEKIKPTIQPASDLWVKKWSQKGGEIRIKGKFCLTGGLLIGSQFSRTKGVKLEVEHYSDFWKSSEFEPTFNTTPILSLGNNRDSKKTVVILSVSQNIKNQVDDFLNQEKMQYKEVYNILPGLGAGHNSLKTEREAVSYAKIVKETIDSLQAGGTKEILLFINTPLSLSVIIGHWLTATCPIQTFEFDGLSYQYSCKI